MSYIKNEHALYWASMAVRSDKNFEKAKRILDTKVDHNHLLDHQKKLIEQLKKEMGE